MCPILEQVLKPAIKGGWGLRIMSVPAELTPVEILLFSPGEMSVPPASYSVQTDPIERRI